MKKKTAKKKKPAPVHALARRHPDSVVVDDDVVDVIPAGRGWQHPAPAPSAVPDVTRLARDLLVQAKCELGKHAGVLPAHVTLVLESDDEVEAALMLEAQGRGVLRVYEEGGVRLPVFEFNEESVGGVLRGTSLGV